MCCIESFQRYRSVSICYVPGAALVVVVRRKKFYLEILNLEDTTMHNNDIIFFTDNSGKTKNVWCVWENKKVKKTNIYKFAQYIYNDIQNKRDSFFMFF